MSSKSTLKSLLIVFLFSAISCRMLNAQNTISESNNAIFFTLGQGYEDGMISITRMPTIGLGYERKLNEYFSAYIRIFTFYRTSSNDDKNYLNTLNAQLIGTNSSSKNKGIIGLKDINERIKILSVPLTLGIRFEFVEFSHHSFSLHAGWTIAYESFGWWKDYLPVDIYTEEGHVGSETYYVSIPTEHRHIVMGCAIGLSYQYTFPHSALTLFFGDQYHYLGDTNKYGFFDLALMYKIYF